MSIGEGGRSLELYFIDGKPDGMLTAEVFNWTGHILMTPRTQIAQALDRKEARFTGVYILLGERDDGPLAYIGEGEDISERIRNHDSTRDWWTTAVFVTSTANNLHKAHVKYLEARLVEEAKSVGKVDLDNSNTPSRPGLSESAQANMEAFLNYLLMVLPALRIDMFLKNTRPAVAVDGVPPHEELDLLFVLEMPSVGLRATANFEGGDFIVQAGSLARAHYGVQGSAYSGYRKLHAELVKTGVLLPPEGELRIFSENYAFKSASAAASVVLGRSANGTTEWKVQGSGQTYKEWEASQLAHDNEGAPT